MEEKGYENQGIPLTKQAKMVYNKVYLRGFALYCVKSKQKMKLFN